MLFHSRFWKGLVSYQGIALAMPQIFDDKCPPSEAALRITAHHDVTRFIAIV